MSDSFGRRTSFQTKAVADAANPKMPKLLGARANVACCVSLGRSLSKVHVSADHFYSLFFGFSGVEICMSHFKTHIQALTWLCLILFSAVRGRERFTSGRGRESSQTKGLFFFKLHIVLPEVIWGALFLHLLELCRDKSSPYLLVIHWVSIFNPLAVSSTKAISFKPIERSSNFHNLRT